MNKIKAIFIGRKSTLTLGLLLFVFLAGCVSKPITRGWIGGEFLETDSSHNKNKPNFRGIRTLPDLVKTKKQNSAVFVDRIYDKTPLSQSGVKVGDIILKADNKTVEDFETLREIVDKKVPGSKLKLSIYRSENIIEKEVTVGKEICKNNSTYSFYIPLLYGDLFQLYSSKISIFNIIGYNIYNSRPELHSPVSRYIETINPKLIKNKKKPAYIYREWTIFLFPFQYSSGKKILEQKIVDKENNKDNKKEKIKNQ